MYFIIVIGLLFPPLLKDLRDSMALQLYVWRLLAKSSHIYTISFQCMKTLSLRNNTLKKNTKTRACWEFAR